MAKGVQLSEEMKQFDFHTLAQKEADPKARVRLLILMHIKNGKTKTATAEMFGFTRNTITTLIETVNRKGLEGIYDSPRSGRPPFIGWDQARQFRHDFLKAQKSKKGGRLTGYDAQKMLSEKGIHYKMTAIYELLEKLGLSWISSRSAHPKRNEEAQAAFKKTSQKKLSTLCHQL